MFNVFKRVQMLTVYPLTLIQWLCEQLHKKTMKTYI